jgi:hypothetical protein
MNPPAAHPLAAAVIITSYNYARFVRETIDSALAQTYPRTRTIVVDDGSTDGSQNVIRSYGPRITAILKSNAGQASAFNAGFAATAADVAIFLDSDDVLLPDAVESAVTLMQEGDVAKVHWPLVRMDEAGVEQGLLELRRPLDEGDLQGQVIESGPDGYGWPPTSGNAWSRHFLEKVLPIPEREFVTCPDSYLAALAPLYGRIARASQPLTRYRVHPNNSMGKIQVLERMDRFDACCAELARRLAARGIEADQQAWKQRDATYQDLAAQLAWQQREAAARRAIAEAQKELDALLPADERIIFVDDQRWLELLRFPARPLPFTERGGEYWGPPATDAAAIAELQRLRAAGARYIIFAAPGFWWLEHYAAFMQYLDAHFPRVHQSEHLIVFKLYAVA